jgi:hypothetical protein
VRQISDVGERLLRDIAEPKRTQVAIHELNTALEKRIRARTADR